MGKVFKMGLKMYVNVNRILEFLKWIGLFLGVFFAFLWGGSPLEQFNIFAVFVLVSVAGLTGIELIFFGKNPSKLSVTPESVTPEERAYNRQSGLYNFALAVTALFAYLAGWSFYAEAALLAVLVLFLLFSAVNHAYAMVKEGKNSTEEYSKAVLAVILILVSFCFISQVF
jgi:hypothetical protein